VKIEVLENGRKGKMWRHLQPLPFLWKGKGIKK
jgi:hypothetical protein